MCKEVKPWLPFALGILAVVVSFFPFYLLGVDSYINPRDQLDGEVLVYILRAQNFFAPVIEQFMNGMPATSLTPPSMGTLVLYMFMEPFSAYLANYVLMAVIAFCSMYVLLDRLLDNKWLAWIIGLMYSQLPFFSVYGLSVMGQPLLLYACVCIWQGEKPWKAFALTAFFGCFTSLVLVGYADLFLMLCMALVMQIRKHPATKYAWMQLAILFVILLLPNISLLGNILAPSDLVSHKTEMAISSSPLVTTFIDAFVNDQPHANALHSRIVPWLLAASAAGLLLYNHWTDDQKHKIWWLWGMLGAAVAIAGIYALWGWEPIVKLRRALGGIFTSFQADRFYWLSPCVWFVALGFLVWFLLQFAKHSVVQKISAWTLAVVLLGVMAVTVYRGSNFRTNFDILRNPTNPATVEAWDSLYSPELFEEIEEYIGLPQESYKVASVGLYPSVPLYNGFYCIDGYSNNYDVEYKHAFRKIISKELEKSNDIQWYFDAWGNRCYVFSAELGKNYVFTKDEDRTIENLELSHDALKELDCDYIFSGVEIGNPEDSGLEYLASFEHEDSPYRISVYSVK